jgi:hypothetical protein
LAPSYFQPFPTLKEFLGGRRFKSDEEAQDSVKERLNVLAAEVNDEGIQKLVARYDRCLMLVATVWKNNLGFAIIIC